MKIFTFSLFFVSFISLGFIDESKPSGDDENKQLFEQSLFHFLKGFELLINLAKKDYAPAQQALGHVSQDLKKIKNYIEDHNREKSTLVFPPIGYSQNFFQKIRNVLLRDISFADKEFFILFFSGKFSDALGELTKGFHLLDILEERDYEPAKQFQSNFGKELIDAMKKMRLPVYPLTKELNQKCRVIFSNYFSSKKQ